VDRLGYEGRGANEQHEWMPAASRRAGVRAPLVQRRPRLFAVAAQHMSFAKAANELSHMQSVVSRCIADWKRSSVLACWARLQLCAGLPSLAANSCFERGAKTPI
jgi:hypothetical protein